MDSDCSDATLRRQLHQISRDSSTLGDSREPQYVSDSNRNWSHQLNASSSYTPLERWEHLRLSIPTVGEQVLYNVPSDHYYDPATSQTASQPSPSATASGPMFTSEGRAQCEEADVLSTVSGEDEVEIAEDATPTTAAELRSQRRKMKRFRLTHTQTRFLMSEYARQAHPDAAQRERLSREIPGLSPRQVQVWFQNRRAKLKRLTAGDRERMLESRALPVGLDTIQALRYASGSPVPAGGPGRPSSFFHPMQYAHDARRPTIMTGGLRSGDEAAGITSPVSLSSSFGDPLPTYGSFSASETFSSASPFSERSHFFTPPISHGSSPHMQASSRPRAASLALPPHASMSHVAEHVEHDRLTSGSIAQQRPFRQDMQQNFAFGEDAFIGTDLSQNIPHHAYQGTPYLPNGPPPQHGIAVTGQASYDPSNFMSSTTYPLPASESVMAPKEHIMPLRPLQSAPLAAPTEYLPPQPSSSYPPVNFPFYQIPGPTEPGQISHSDAPYGIDTASLLRHQNSLYQLQRDEPGDYTPTQDAYAQWNMSGDDVTLVKRE
ncbi:MAG: hypothetical protein Q9208_003481 [Pyrenodesmia sp. 3 TL-2023]